MEPVMRTSPVPTALGDRSWVVKVEGGDNIGGREMEEKSITPLPHYKLPAWSTSELGEGTVIDGKSSLEF